MPLLLDTGFIYALADRDDAWHQRARKYLEQAPDALLVPAMVIPEAAYLIRDRLGPRQEGIFVLALAKGEMAIEPLAASDLHRSLILMKKYPAIGFVDASVAATAERLRLLRIATTDRRHFGALRPAHAAAFELVP
jgi:predicted nucleic acid-binding protein